MNFKKRSLAAFMLVIVLLFAALVLCPGRLSAGRTHVDKIWIILGKNGVRHSDWPMLFNQKDAERPLGIGVSAKVYGVRVGSVLFRVTWVTENPL